MYKYAIVLKDSQVFGVTATDHEEDGDFPCFYEEDVLVAKIKVSDLQA